jgi:cytochrome c biogenesis protein CcmG, thiol:disulfide interchange protein DsbE
MAFVDVRMDPDRSPKPTRAVARWVIVPAVCAAMVLAACGGSGQPAGSGSASSPTLLPSSPTALPAFDPAAFRRLLGQLKGRPVVVNFWGSWCGPCTIEAPGLAVTARRFAGRVQFLGVDVLDRRTPAEAFIRRYGWTYPSLFDATGAIKNSLGLLGQPVTLLYDAAGKQVFTWSGPVTPAQLERQIEKILPK